ncbi:MAG: lipopolysaccharide biosynthesis protein [Deltaproteobacteria bacterium]|nr:lipopolysaccharide biosynthesis protein [Deltaproteobacteria bacterium]
MPESLSKTVVQGIRWVTILRIVNRSLDFVRTIVLARLLSPYDFGLAAIGFIAISMLETFSQTGFQTALISKKQDIESYLDTAWTVSVFRGILLFAIMLFSAPLVALFFNSPDAEWVVRIIAFSLLISGFQNIGVLFFQKELEFDKQFRFEFSGAVVNFLITVGLALLLRNVWALVLGGLAANLFRLAISYMLHPYRPSVRFNREKFLEMFSFGKWVFISSIVIFLSRQGDDAFLGKLLGITALGFYQLAFLIGNIPASEIGGVISKVAFPAYVKLQTSPDKLKEAYLRTVSFVILLSLPLTGGIIVLAPLFTHTVLGEKWVPVILPLQILALSGLFRAVSGAGGALFNSIGKPRFDFIMNFSRLIIIIITIYPLTMLWGIAGTSISVLLGILAAFSVWLRQSIKESMFCIGDIAPLSAVPLISAFSMCAVLFFMLKIDLYNQTVLMAVSIIAGVIVYGAMLLFCSRFFKYKAFQEMLSFFRGSREE